MSTSPGSQALAAPIHPETAETISAELVSDVLRLLRAQVDYVVIDTPPVLDGHVVKALSQSDLVALLLTPDSASLEQFRMTLSALDTLGHPRERIRAVMNRVSAANDSFCHQLEAAVPMPIAAFIPASREVQASIGNGQPLVLEAPEHPVSKAIFDFAIRSVY